MVFRFVGERVVDVGPFLVTLDSHQARINLLRRQPGLSGRKDAFLAEEVSRRNLILLVGLGREPNCSHYLTIFFDRGSSVGRSELFVVAVERIKDSSVQQVGCLSRVLERRRGREDWELGLLDPFLSLLGLLRPCSCQILDRVRFVEDQHV